MIAIATGKEKLDVYLKNNIDNSQIISYSEHFTETIPNKYEIAIISNELEGSIEFKQLLFALRSRNIRVIYLCKNEEQFEESDKVNLKDYLGLGMYDVVFLDEVSLEGLKEVINNPLKFTDDKIQKLYIKYVNEEVEELKESKVKLSGLLKKDEKETQIVEKIVEKEVEKPVFIEKEVIKVEKFRYDSVIALVGAASNGKSFISWNLAHALSQSYKVAHVCIDKNYSAANLYGVEVNDDEFPFHNIEANTLNLNELINKGFKINKNLTVYTGKFASGYKLRNDVLLKLITALRAENNIVIIDTETNYLSNSNLNTVMSFANDIVVMYDCDNSHYKLNDYLLKNYEDKITSNNCIALINNVYTDSKELIKVNKQLRSKKLFRDVVIVNNAGVSTYDYIYSPTCNYNKEENLFTADIDELISCLKLKGKERRTDKDKGEKGSQLFSLFRRRK